MCEGLVLTTKGIAEFDHVVSTKNL